MNLTVAVVSHAVASEAGIEVLELLAVPEEPLLVVEHAVRLFHVRFDTGDGVLRRDVEREVEWLTADWGYGGVSQSGEGCWIQGQVKVGLEVAG